jgi:hypothetical protein
MLGLESGAFTWIASAGVHQAAARNSTGNSGSFASLFSSSGHTALIRKSNAPPIIPLNFYCYERQLNDGAFFSSLELVMFTGAVFAKLR